MRIWRRQNYRNIELKTPNTAGDVVGVWQKDANPKYCTWLGLITREEAKKTGRPVKLIISRIDSYDLKEGEFVHGCWTRSGVYAVVDIALVST